jgi:hypothetical protein
MPMLARRVNYQAASGSRESAQLVDMLGREVPEAEAVKRLGGKNAAYVEVLSAPSRLECEAICVRRPDLDREDAMAAHFAAQARIMDPTGKAIVAVHGDADGGHHAHILLPGVEKDYKQLSGENGFAQWAWKRAYWQERPEAPIRDLVANRQSKELGKALADLDFKGSRNALTKGQREALKNATTAQDRLAIRENFRTRERDLEARHRELKLAQLEVQFAARGMAGSLDHQVEIEFENVRHQGEARRAEARRIGQEAYQARYNSADLREAFKHMSALERVAVRAKALERELVVLKARFDAEKRFIDQDPTRFEADKPDAKVEQDRHCEEACKGALLRHQATLLRDREEGIAKAPGQSIAERLVRNRLRRCVSRIPGASIGLRAQALLGRTELMQQRHPMEREALVAEAQSKGLKEPSPKALAKLETRQAKECKGLAKSKAKLALLTPTRQATRTLKRFSTRAIVGSISKARQGLKKLMEASKKGKGVEKPRSMEYLEAGQQAAEGAALGVVTGAGKVALMVAVEAGKAALHQAQNAGQAVAVTAQAIATGIVNPFAGAKVAAEGYSKVGATAAKNVVQDAQSGGKAVTKDAMQAGRDSAQQALTGLGSMGLAAAPPELQASIRATKEATMAALKTAKSLITLDFIGAGASAGEGVLGVAKEGSAMLHGSLPMPVEKVVDLASKIPLVGIVAKGAKIAAELGIGASNAAKIIEISR